MRRISSVCGADSESISLSTMPGNTALTRMPAGPSSSAQVRTSMSSAAFDAEYAAMPGVVTDPAGELVTMIEPPAPIAPIAPASARTNPRVLTVMTCSNTWMSSASISPWSASMPALRTRQSIRPSMVPRTRAATDSGVGDVHADEGRADRVGDLGPRLAPARDRHLRAGADEVFGDRQSDPGRTADDHHGSVFDRKRIGHGLHGHRTDTSS